MRRWTYTATASGRSYDKPCAHKQSNGPPPSCVQVGLACRGAGEWLVELARCCLSCPSIEPWRAKMRGTLFGEGVTTRWYGRVCFSV